MPKKKQKTFVSKPQKNAKSYLVRHFLHDHVVSEIFSAITFIVEENYLSFLDDNDDTIALVKNWLTIELMDEFQVEEFRENESDNHLVKKNINNILDR